MNSGFRGQMTDGTGCGLRVTGCGLQVLIYGYEINK